MGIMERESARRARKGYVEKIILSTVATAGLLSVAMLAPNALKAFKFLGLVPGKRQGEVIKNSRKRLVAGGYLEYSDGGRLRLTSKGGDKLRLLRFADHQARRPRRWDKRWRVLIFDVKEERKDVRDKLRRTLVSIGFARLQDSVWVYPYDCEDFITLLKAEFRIGKEVIYMIVDSIENDKWLKEFFGLIV